MRRRLFTIAILLVSFFSGVVPGPASAAPTMGSLVKASGDAVYYLANDGKRYVFPNAKTYRSWFSDFSAVMTITDAELASFRIGGNVTYRPGIRMIKIQSDPRIYAVAPGGTLRWVTSETAAEDLYGQFWNTAVDDVSDAFFVNYVMGDPIHQVEEFSPYQAALAVPTIDEDLHIIPAATAPQSDTEVANIVDGWRAYALAHINELRQSVGKGPLAMNPLLNRISTIHSRDMAKHDVFAHEGTLGETPDDRIRYGKVPDVTYGAFMTVPHPEDIDWSGENIGEASRRPRIDSVEATIKKLHDLFMDEPVDQPNHRTTMLSTLHPYAEVGVGPYVDAAGTLWLTEDYISF